MAEQFLNVKGISFTGGLHKEADLTLSQGLSNTYSADKSVSGLVALNVNQATTYTGSVTVAETLGPELITNGDFESATGWNLQAGITISGGNIIMATDANQNAKRTDVSVVSGTTYRFEINITSYTDGTPRVNFGGTLYDLTGAAGIQTIDRVAGATDSDFNLYGGTFADGGNWTAAYVSLKEVL